MLLGLTGARKYGERDDRALETWLAPIWRPDIRDAGVNAYRRGALLGDLDLARANRPGWPFLWQERAVDLLGLGTGRLGVRKHLRHAHRHTTA